MIELKYNVYYNLVFVKLNSYCFKESCRKT